MIVAELRDAEITIVGGGAIGCAVAYCLAHAGYRDIQVIERGELAAATSSQAAGLVGQVRGSLERTRLAMASVALARPLWLHSTPRRHADTRIGGPGALPSRTGQR